MIGKVPLSLKDGDILYIGSWKPGHEGDFVPDHPHGNFYEITVITSGSGTIYTDNIPTRVSQGDVYISYPFDHHRIESDSESNMNYCFISFTVTNAPYSTEFAKIWIENISANKRVIRNDKIHSLICELVSENDTCDNDKLSIQLLSGIFSRLLITFLRFLAKDIGKTTPNITLCCEIITYIDANFYSIESLKEISKYLGYHYNYMTSVFHKTTKISLSKYYITRKLELARTLLAKSDMTVTRVAKILKYSSVQSFSKSFYKHYLVYPREWLMMCRKL